MPIRKFTLTHHNRLQTLLNFISHNLTISKNKAKQLLDKRHVFVNKKRVWIASYQLQKGDIVEVVIDDTELLNFTSKEEGTGYEKVNILFHDDFYLIVSKPPYLLTNGADSLESHLRERFKNNQIQAVHRLDRDTSGAVIFAMDKDAFERMKSMFKNNLVKKVYMTIVQGRVEKQTFTINTPIQGQKAITHAKTFKKGTIASYLEVMIETGRTHQIRIHLASVGHPVIGEREYNRKPINNPLLRHVARQMLHSYQIAFTHPYTQKTISISADIPEDFRQCLKNLGLKEKEI
jgi:23S rRNA pseudouridine1911/1915/1917 synthase